MIYVQHLLGVGHLKRMALLANALAAEDVEVLLASGGLPASQIETNPAVRFHQLEPIKAIDMAFSGLANARGQPVDEAMKQRRTNDLLDQYGAFRPDVLVVELFPLGRRQMRFELLPLLETARPTCPLIACSVRDIVNNRPRREDEAIGWLNDHFDLLLVHGDEAVTPIRECVPGIDSFNGMVRHTGYLTESWTGTFDRQNEVLVSAGGGAAGEGLFRAAVGAARLSKEGFRWRIRHGEGASAAFIEELKAAAPTDTIIEPVAGGFRDTLAACRISISQFGYNTAMDILSTRTPAIVVPFEGAGETEQLRRADAFTQSGLSVLREADLTCRSLAEAVSEAASRQVLEHRIDLHGLQRSVQLLRVS